MGKVFLVGAGPGDPELLTVKAARVLRSADVVLHDSLVSREVLALASPGVRLVHVGKRCGRQVLPQEEINALLIYYAGTVETVVRLKGGDPSIFGRTGEEIEALRGAGVSFEIVPGVTSAVAAAASAGIPLTDRRFTSQVLFTTAHRAAEQPQACWDSIRHAAATLAIYMPGHDYRRVCRSLEDAGLPPDTPCVIVSCASLKGQQICWTDLGHLATQAPLPAPALLIVGAVARSAAGQLEESRLARQTAF